MGADMHYKQESLKLKLDFSFSSLIKLYYENKTSSSYRIYEKVLKETIKIKTKYINDKGSLNLMIYYKSLKTDTI